MFSAYVKICAFQFLDRNSFGSDQASASSFTPPQSSFNSSIGILSVRTPTILRMSSKQRSFQFLDRNSFGSDSLIRVVAGGVVASFNSSIGILSVRTTYTTTISGTEWEVSIPRSEFFRFGPPSTEVKRDNIPHVSIPRSEFFRFGLEDGYAYVRLSTPVSIPRSEFFRFGPRTPAVPQTTAAVSIPRSEFFRFGPNLHTCDRWTDHEFQFLDRNSFGSDNWRRRWGWRRRRCFNSSIGILSVRTPLWDIAHKDHLKVSIPRSEFFRFGLGGRDTMTTKIVKFQFLDRNSFGSDVLSW